MFVKLELTGKLEILTGLHIGGESALRPSVRWIPRWCGIP